MNLVMIAGMCKWVEWGLGGDELEAHWATSSKNPSHGRGYPRLRSSTANRRPGCHLPWGDSGKAWKIPDAKNSLTSQGFSIPWSASGKGGNLVSKFKPELN